MNTLTLNYKNLLVKIEITYFVKSHDLEPDELEFEVKSVANDGKINIFRDARIIEGLLNRKLSDALHSDLRKLILEHRENFLRGVGDG